uniref:PH domain-containing protein n=1 Tax=Ditylenchus dipsaci TaxID=166011 RepID=A0A915D3H3_9BILA
MQLQSTGSISREGRGGQTKQIRLHQYIKPILWSPSQSRNEGRWSNDIILIRPRRSRAALQKAEEVVVEGGFSHQQICVFSQCLLPNQKFLLHANGHEQKLEEWSSLVVAAVNLLLVL